MAEIEAPVSILQGKFSIPASTKSMQSVEPMMSLIFCDKFLKLGASYRLGDLLPRISLNIFRKIRRRLFLSLQ